MDAARLVVAALDDDDVDVRSFVLGVVDECSLGASTATEAVHDQ